MGRPPDDIVAAPESPSAHDSSEKSPAACFPPQSVDSAGLANDNDEEAQATGLADQKPQQQWNESRQTMIRLAITLYSFIVMGMHDSVTGALIPYIEPYYNLTYTVVSLLFLSSFAGYFVAALANSFIHHHFGQVGVAFVGPLSRVVGYIALACHPPYPVLPVMMLLPGFGNGIEDSAWNAWIGNMENANELLGILHGAYGLGATISPLIATSMVTKGHLQWYTFYYVMVGLASLESFLAVAAFWGATGRVYRESHKAAGGKARTTTRQVLKEPITWLVSLFLLGYVGVEVSLGGWIVTFMIKVRHAPNFDAGMTATGFWLGLTVGRVCLGFITGRIGEKLAVAGYVIVAFVFQLLYWLVPSFIASGIFVAFIGFFIGPLFPAAVVAATKLLPVEYHVSAIGFAAAFGGGGAAIFPFAVGAIAQSKGVEVLQPVAIAIFAFIFIAWCLIPGGLRPGGLEYAREHHEPVGKFAINIWKKVFGKKCATAGVATAADTDDAHP